MRVGAMSRAGVSKGLSVGPLSKRTALRSGDPLSVGTGELEGHDTAVPAPSLSLRDARAERGRVDEAVGRVGCTTRLADDELIEVDAVRSNLKQG